MGIDGGGLGPALGRAAVLGALICVQYVVVAVNMRAVAHCRYGWIAVTDAIILALGFTLIRHVAEARTAVDQVAYIIGGTVGALGGVWLSRHWK